MEHTSKVTEVGGNQKVDEYMEWRSKPKTKDNRQPKNDGPKESNGQGIQRTKDSVAPEGKEGQIMGAQRQRRGKVTGGPSHGVPTMTENQKEMRSSEGRLPEPVMDKVNRGPRAQDNTQSQGNTAAQGMQTLETKVHPKTYGVPRQTWAPDVTEVRASGGKESSEDNTPRTQWIQEKGGPKTKEEPRICWGQGQAGPKNTKGGQRQRRTKDNVGPKAALG
ncbi:hypothetical protein DFH28DRAFT_923412 [Melampsora americana]|nr:hypothetical protein DFH28DRAFT_923412 [Melampsora americana]